MARGTFANIRLVNKFLEKTGPRTKHWPSGEVVRESVENLFAQNPSLFGLLISIMGKCCNFAHAFCYNK